MANTNEDRIAAYERVIRRGFDEYVSYGVTNALIGYLHYNNALIQSGTTMLPDGTIPQVVSNQLAASSLREEATMLVSSKTLLLPPGSLLLGNLLIDSANHGIGATNTSNNQKGLGIIQTYASGTGSSLPNYYEFPAMSEVDRQLLFDETQPSDPYSYTFTFGSSAPPVLWTGLVLRPSEAGTFAFTIRATDANGAEISRMSGFTFEASDIGSDTTISLSNSILLLANETIHITLEGARLLGSTVNNQFVPYFKAVESTVTFRPLATQQYVQQQMGSGAAEPVSITANLTINATNYTTYNFIVTLAEGTATTDLTITLAALSTFPASTAIGFTFVNNSTNTRNVIISRSGSDTIGGLTSYTLQNNEGIIIRRPLSGTNWIITAFYLSQVRLTENIQDTIGSSVVAGTGITVTYDDTAGTTTITNTGGLLAPISETTTIRIDEVNYTSFNGRIIECQATGTGDQTITLGAIADLPANTPIDYLFVNNRATASNVIISASTPDTVGGDASITLAVGQSVRVTRPLAGSVWLITADAFPPSVRTELIQDTIGTAVVAGAGISVTYDDTAGTTTITNTGGGGTMNQLPLQVSADVTITTANVGTYNNRFVSGTATGTAVQTITLPELSTLTAALAVQFTFTNKRASASTLRIARSGSDTISNFNNIDIPNDNTITIIRPFSGTDWTIVSEYDQIKAGYSIPVASAFSINIASRVNLNTNLNVSQTINYNILHTSNIQSLELFVSDGDNIALTIPTTDGAQTATPTLANIDTSTAKTLTFRVQGVDTQNPGVAFQSNEQTVEVRNVLAQQLLYWGVEATNTASTFDYANAENQEALSGNITIPQFTGNQYLKFAYPASAAAVTQLTIGGVNQLSAFTLTSDALTINTVLYDVLVSNNALDGAVVSGNTVTIVR